MNKAELVKEVAAATRETKKLTEKMVRATFDIIIHTLAEGEPVNLVGFGKFDARKHAARLGRNPKTKEAVHIPAKRKPIFKAGKELCDAVID